jgi:hypothetical protein
MKKQLLNNTTLKPLLDPTITPLSDGKSATTFVERKEFLSAIIGLAVGDASGSPTAQSVAITVQHATNASGTNAEDLTVNGDDITISLDEDGVNSIADIDLTEAREYIGGSIVVNFTGGSMPNIPVNAYIALGDPRDTKNI